MYKVLRYIPTPIKNFLDKKTHIHIKWNNDLSSDVITLDVEGLIICCDTILRLASQRSPDERNFVEIQMDSFHKILHNDYKLYLEYLKDNKIVICDNRYIPGEKALGYKLNEDFVDSLVSIEINNKTFNKRTIKAIKNSNKFKISDKHYKNYMSSFKIDYNSAMIKMNLDYIKGTPDHKGRILTKYKKTLLEHKLLQINDGQLWMSRSSGNGRINSNLTSLNSNYKKFILGYDLSMDITASQPTLLNVLFDVIKDIQGIGKSSSELLSYQYLLLSKKFQKKDFNSIKDKLQTIKLPSEKEQNEWRKLCEDGLIYEHFQAKFKEKTGKVLSRNEVKEIMFEVLYSTVFSKKTEYKEIFEYTFPSINKFIKNIKYIDGLFKSNRVLPLMLQGIESFIWVENILPILDKNKIKYLFIHDCIIVKKSDMDLSEYIIKKEFYDINIKVKISIEDIKTSKKIN